MHPMWRQRKLRRTCGEHKIHVSAYSPLGGPGNAWGSTAVVNHSIIQSIALKHNATPAQVIKKLLNPKYYLRGFFFVLTLKLPIENESFLLLKVRSNDK
jgi:hypothetical protein